MNDRNVNRCRSRLHGHSPGHNQQRCSVMNKGAIRRQVCTEGATISPSVMRRMHQTFMCPRLHIVATYGFMNANQWLILLMSLRSLKVRETVGVVTPVSGQGAPCPLHLRAMHASHQRINSSFLASQLSLNL